jgi:D-hydantoinase
MFEPSSEMLALFGGAGGTGASSCFEQIPPVKEDEKRYGRKNVLLRESQHQSEWKEVTRKGTAAACFATIENHDEKYEEARHRGNWESTGSQFAKVSHGKSATLPGPDLSEQEPSTSTTKSEGSPICPAEEVLRERAKQRLRNGAPVLPEGPEQTSPDDVEVVITEEFVSNEIGKAETLRRHRPSDDVRSRYAPGPEMADDLEDSEPPLNPKEEANESPQLQKESSSGQQERGHELKTERDGHDTSRPIGTPAEGMDFHAEKGPGNAQQSIENGAGVAENAGDVVTSNSAGGGQAVDSTHNPANGAISQAERDGDASDGGSGMVAVNGNGESSSNGSGGGGGPNLLIKGAQIVNDDAIFTSDILIEDGTIKKIEESLSAPENVEVIDATGKYVLPAGIDVHTEFSAADTVDDFASGTKAALAGGTTTIIDVVVPRTNETLEAAADRVRTAAENKSVCNVGISVLIAKWDEITKKGMEKVVQEKGVNSFILELFSDSDLFEALDHAKRLGAHARILPENREIISILEKRVLQLGINGLEGYAKARPPQLEAEWISRIGVLSQLTNCPFSVLSVASTEGARAIQTARHQGTLVHAEVSAAALLPSSSIPSVLTRIPIRSEPQNASDVIELLANGTLSMCVSDHKAVKSSHNAADFTKMPCGAAGVEERMAVLWEKAVATGRIDPMKFVAVTSTNAAKAFNLYPNKGRIAVGSDADIVLWNVMANKQLSAKTHSSKSDVSIFESQNVRATPALTICDGLVVYRDHQLISGKPRFCWLKPSPPHLFSIVQLREHYLPAGISLRSESSDSRPKTDTKERPVTSGSSASRNATSTEAPKRSTTKVIHPPGGKSTALW